MSSDDEYEHECGRHATHQVSVHGNHVFFYGEVTTKSVLKLNVALRKVACQLPELKTSYIRLFIQSEGGDLYAGLSAMDHISTLGVPVHTVVDGFVASAATLMVLAGSQKFIMPHAHVLIHQLSSTFWGKYQDMVDEYRSSKRLMKMLKRIYLKHTKMTEDDLEEALNRETYMNARKAIVWGFADATYTP